MVGVLRERGAGLCRGIKVKTGNCILYALRQWLRHGGYLIVRKSRFLWLVPHVLWAPPGGLDEATVRHFVPEEPTRQPWRVWRALWFRGRVKTDDRG